MTADQALEFVRHQGVVLEGAHGPVPNLAEAVAGESIRGSWWGHRQGKEIFGLTRAIRASPDVHVCRLVDGKITYIHRRLWPALVRLADAFPRERLARVTEQHTPSGKHRASTTPFPRWVPPEVDAAARRLTEEEATTALATAGLRP